MKFYYKEEQTKQIFRIFPPLLPILYNIYMDKCCLETKKSAKRSNFKEDDNALFL